MSDVKLLFLLVHTYIYCNFVFRFANFVLARKSYYYERECEGGVSSKQQEHIYRPDAPRIFVMLKENEKEYIYLEFTDYVVRTVKNMILLINAEFIFFAIHTHTYILYLYIYDVD